MVSKVRAQEEAERLTRGAEDPSLNGAGTPPSAFEADEAVTQFMAKWLSMTAGLGDMTQVCVLVPPGSHGVTPPPCNLPQPIVMRGFSPQAWTTKYASVDALRPHRSSCPAHSHKQVEPHPTGFQSSPVAFLRWCSLRIPPLVSLLDFVLITAPTRVHGHLCHDTRSPGSLAAHRPRHLGRLGLHGSECSNTANLRAFSSCPYLYWKSTGESAYILHNRDRCCKQWYIPTLLRNRAFQIHPWTRRGGHRRRARTGLPDLARPSLDAQSCSPVTAIISCTDAYTALDVLHAILSSLPAAPSIWAYAGALMRLLWPEPYSSLLLQLVSQTTRCICSYAQPKQLAGHTRHLPTVMKSHPHTRTGDDAQHRAAATQDAHTQPPRSPTNMHTRGPPGPKSGERSRVPTTRSAWTYRAIVWLLRIQISTGTLDARVVTSAQGVTGAGIHPSTQVIRTPAKPSLGTQATHESHPRSSTRVHKRTYARALRRAQLKGGAWYRGSAPIPVSLPRIGTRTSMDVLAP